MESIKIYFLHGFLGLPKDWEAVARKLENRIKCQTFSVDYLNQAHLGPQHSFDDWAQHFNHDVETLTDSGSKNILVGYSLGGRLALHAFENKPSLWHRIVCLSTNPGFDDNLTVFDPHSEERRQRWINDSLWSDEFQHLPWEKVIAKWNAQSVFGQSSNEPMREEVDYKKELLGLALTQWSLSKQKNFRPLVMRYSDRFYWLVGDKDVKFIEITESMSKKMTNLFWNKVPEAGHRVIFDNPEFVADRLAELIRKS